MKKTRLAIVLTIFVVLAAVFLLKADEALAADKKKALVVYYSLTGSTKTVAEYIHKSVGGDMAEIRTITPYPEDFHAVVEQARDERRTGFLPPIHRLAFSPKDYDVIYLGFPIWGNTVPQPVATFLAQNNLAGKTIVPFCTHDGYGVGRSLQVIKERYPSARVLDGFDTLGSGARTSQSALNEWLQKNAVETVRSSGTETHITVNVGGVEVSGVLNSSPAAREFRSRLPERISMVRYGGREYYGGIDTPIKTQERGQLDFEDGHITYCPQNNTIAIFYAQTDRPNLTMRVIPIGKITSDLSVFHDMESSVHASFRVAP